MLLFSGFDLWRYGAFSHSGALFLPAGAHDGGAAFKILLGGGAYAYRADFGYVLGLQEFAALQAGYRFKTRSYELTLLGGADFQQHRLYPDDPASRLRGTRLGLSASADLWYQLTDETMLNALASVSTIGSACRTRLAVGRLVLDRFWIGPEAEALGDTEYQQYRLGMHVTGFPVARFELSASAGWVGDSDHRHGFYGRFGMLRRR
jgi:hypothetical protein